MNAVDDRARLHAALGNPARLRIADALVLGDRRVNELGSLTGLPGNLLAHHLDVLEDAGLIERRRSEGDQRTRYVVLRHQPVVLSSRPPHSTHRPLFVCTHNSARSQFAAALWREQTGGEAESAGTDPADRVHPQAVAVAADLGVDLSGAVPTGYEAITVDPSIVVSVCDRARETTAPTGNAPDLHWSIPDPVLVGTNQAFRDAFGEIAERLERLAAARAR